VVCDDRNCSGLSQSSVMWRFVTTETVQDCHSQVWCGGLWRPKLFRIVTVKCDVAVCDNRNCSGLSQSSVTWRFVTTETVQDCHSQVWCGGLWRPKLFRIVTVKCDVAVCDDRNCSGLSQSSVTWRFVTTETVQDCHSQVWCDVLNRERPDKRFCTEWWNSSQPTTFENVNPKL